MYSSTLVALTFAASAYAAIYVTSPVASTTCNAGSTCTVSWQDDGTSPSLSSFGPAMISVYIGNANQQTMVQNISPSTDVSQTQTLNFTPDATMGSNGNPYFIRFQSLGLEDASNPQFPALAFSSKFTLADMTGNFNSTEQSEIDGTTTAPIGVPTTSVQSTTGTSGSQTASSSSNKASSSGTASSTAKQAAASSGAEKLVMTGTAGFLGMAVALFGLAL